MIVAYPSIFVNNVDKIKSRSHRSDFSARLAWFQSQIEQRVQKLTIRGHRANGLCPFHGEDTPSFSADFQKGVFNCFGCGVSGGVKQFAELIGEQPPSSCRTSTGNAKAKVVRLAVQAAQQSFRDWERARFRELVTQYHQLDLERKAAEVAYRAIRRANEKGLNLYTREELDHWTKRLAALYDKLSALDVHLDFLLLREFQADRLQWWDEEVRRGEFHV